MTFEQAKKFTTENFARYVAPILREKFNAVKVVDTELLADEESKKLDCEHCIDGYFVTSDGEKAYFASRIQRGKNWHTFTIRAVRDTRNIAEFEKLCKLIGRGERYPKWFIQTYIQNNSVTISVIETKKLIDFIKKKNPPVRHTRSDKHGQAAFFVCDWTQLKKFGADVQIFEIVFETKKSAKQDGVK